MPYHYPPTASRIKSLIHAGKFIKDPFPILDKAVNKLGTTYTFYMGGMQKAILTIDPDTIKHVLQKHHRKYEKSAIVTDILAKYTGHGLLTSTGDHWLQHRRLIQPGFHRKRIESLQSLIQAEIDICMMKWKTFATGNTVFDAYEEMNQLTFRIIAKALFSTSIEEHGLAELSKLISTIQSYVIKEVRQPYKRWWFKLSGTMAHHQKLSQVARDVIREIVRERKHSGQTPDDLLTMLLEARFEESGAPMEDEQLIDECLILFVAGHETSANALSWMIFLLGKNQDAYKKIQSADGENKSAQIRNIILETLRLYPPAWVVDRISLEDDEIGEFILPKDTVWIIYLRGMHRHPKYWNQPDEFIPERWSNHDLNKEAFMPFGAGPRLCIGEHFAMMEMQMIITSISDQWHLELKVETVEQRPLVTLRPGSPVLVSLRERS
ncbi:MAG: cytochrome P450 [Bacteroidota bacterium]|nr:cytochrome P450 [Bacteroidota bacterium]